MSQANNLTQLDRSTLPQYSYSPLPSCPSIRLLHVQRASIEFSDSSNQKLCSLKIHPIDEVPSYTALSYTWGAPVDKPGCIAEYAEPKEWVLEDNGTYYRLSVSKNLYNALNQLTVGEQAIITLWIDALCICQEDLEERANQVKIMGEIYTRCKQTIVWLGRVEDFSCDIPALIRLHDIMCIAFQRYINERLGGHLVRFGNDWTAETFYERLDIQQYQESLDWMEFYKFHQECQWFTRAW